MAKDNRPLKAWARKTKPAMGHRCSTCICGEEIRDAIRIVLRMKANGESEASLPQLHDYLVEELGYPQTIYAMRAHVTRCESDLWAAIRRRAGHEA